MRRLVVMVEGRSWGESEGREARGRNVSLSWLRKLSSPTQAVTKDRCCVVSSGVRVQSLLHSKSGAR